MGTKKDGGKQPRNYEAEDGALLSESETIALNLTKRHKGNVLNPIDSHYCSRGRTGIEETYLDRLWWRTRQFLSSFLTWTIFFPSFLKSSTSRKLAAGTSCCSALGGSREPINVSSQKGEEHSKKPTVPSGHGQWRSRRDRGRQRHGEKEARGLTTCFLCYYILKGITWSMQHWQI